MGKSSSRPVNIQQQIDPFSQASANIANQLFNQTNPLRQTVIGDFNQLLGGNTAAPATSLPNQIISGDWQQYYNPTRGFDIDSYLAANPVAPTTTPAAPDVNGVAALSNVSNILPLISNTAPSLTVNPDNPALFGGAKAALENQFRIAQNRTREILPTGGSLNQGLVDLESGRARSLAQIMADLASQGAMAQERGLDRAIGLGGAQMDINQRNIDRALNLASGGAANALQGFSIGGNLAAQSASAQAAQYQAEQARQGAAKQGLGQAVGMIGKAAIGKCWVARVVYGDNPQWLMFRLWLTMEAPRCLDRVYTKYGERFASYVKDKPVMLRILRNLMDRVI
jgi:hypothetical protein